MAKTNEEIHIAAGKIHAVFHGGDECAYGGLGRCASFQRLLVILSTCYGDQQTSHIALWHEFHKRWTASVGTEGYDKKKWQEMEGILFRS